MSAVVTINGRPCTRRKNYAQDDEPIRIRRLIATFQSAAFADSRADTLDRRVAALALSWAAERKLPCHNLRCIAGTLDAHRDFTVRLADVEVARTEREAFEARRMRVFALEGNEAARSMSDEAERLFERYWQATVDLANAPVFSQADLRRKRRAIGSVWLTAEGARYDVLRAAIANDEARLTKQGRAS